MTGMPQADILLNATIPQLQEGQLPSTGWKLVCADTYAELFFQASGQLLPEIESQLSTYLKTPFNDFRQQVEIKSVPLMLGFFYKDQTVRVYSQRLAQELFLLQSFDKLKDRPSLNAEQNARFENFKQHVEHMASMNAQRFPSVAEVVTHTQGLTDFNHPSLKLNSKAASNTPDINWEQVSKGEHARVQQLLKHMHGYKATSFEKVSDMGLSLTAEYTLLRIHLLKFLAILPSLDHDQKGNQVKRVLWEALRRLSHDSQKAKFLGKKGSERALPNSWMLLLKLVIMIIEFMPPQVLARLVRTSVRFMARRFIAGESIEKAQKSLKDLAQDGRDATLDQLGELVVSEREAELYCQEVLKLIKGLSQHITRGDKNRAGILRSHVSIKVSALCSDFRPEAFEASYKLVAERLKLILTTAKQEQVFIHIDAEHYSYRDLVFKIYRQVLLTTPELADYQQTGIVVQAYLRDAADHLDQVIELAKTRGLAMPIRLVKGAYWDAETVEAEAHSFTAPEFINKQETDIHFRQLVYKIFKSHPHLQLCLASHNFADHCFAESLREQLERQHMPNKLALHPIEHQCLHMTYEALSIAMARMPWAVRNYVPVGGLLVGMAYLVRRIMENSSQVGVLTIMRSHHNRTEIVPALDIHAEKKQQNALKRDSTQLELNHRFFNVGPVRLHLADHLGSVEQVFADFKNKKLGRSYSGKLALHGPETTILCSSDVQIKVGSIQFGNQADAEQAVAKLYQAYATGAWAQAPWEFRAGFLIKAANLMLVRRLELAALMVYEAGKTVNEALADVDEAIDFLNFYAREEGKLQASNFSIAHGTQYASRGVVGVISPWNFPLAIPCGMVVSALVAGNHVVLKSAEQTPLIAQMLIDLLHEVGIPDNVVMHLPGSGEEVGQALVDHPNIAQIVFTGSKAVGMMIHERASKRWVKNPLYGTEYPCHVITEMGGKNAIIVTGNAELDEAVEGILYSAFGHAGQKCSAASRILVDNVVKLRLLERLKEACEDIHVGPSYDFDTFINPIITKQDQMRLQSQAQEASEEARQHQGKVWIDRSRLGQAQNKANYCVGPVVIELPYNRALDPASFSQRELFGPIIHVIGFDQLGEAVALFNATDYALTGGIFSQSQDDIDFLSERLLCGNLYINRTITGARVSIEPFGGFKLSGTGPKAGSKEYVPAFHHYHAFQLKSSDTPDGDGSDYDFDFCHASHIPTGVRLDRISRSVELLIQHFESLFQGIYSDEKEVLVRYQQWLRNHFVRFQTKEHANRVIPGQLSFNDYRQVKQKVALITYEARPYFSTLMNALSALAVGSGLTVMARNSKSYHWWSTLQGIFVQHGIAKAHFDVYFVTERLAQTKLLSPEVEVLIYDGPQARMDAVLKDAYKTQSQYMRQVLSPFNARPLEDFKSHGLNFINVRSFAINTMRHGAPLDVSL